MSIFDLQRLEKANKVFEFPGQDGASVTITCHYPTPAEVAAALCAAKADLQKAHDLHESQSQGLEAMELTARMGAAMEQLACYCIDSCSALSIKKRKDVQGLRRIDDDTEEKLAPVLAKIGQELFVKSNVSPEEGEV